MICGNLAFGIPDLNNDNSEETSLEVPNRGTSGPKKGYVSYKNFSKKKQKRICRLSGMIMKNGLNICVKKNTQIVWNANKEWAENLCKRKK